MEPCPRSGVGGRQKLGQRYSGAAAVCLLYRSGPPCIAAVMLRRLLCGEKIHRKLFLNSGGRDETEGEQVQGGRYHG